MTPYVVATTGAIYLLMWPVLIPRVAQLQHREGLCGDLYGQPFHKCSGPQRTHHIAWATILTALWPALLVGGVALGLVAIPFLPFYGLIKYSQHTLQVNQRRREDADARAKRIAEMEKELGIGD